MYARCSIITYFFVKIIFLNENVNVSLHVKKHKKTKFKSLTIKMTAILFCSPLIFLLAIDCFGNVNPINVSFECVSIHGIIGLL